MDFSSSPIKGALASAIRKVIPKSISKTQKSRFKETSSVADSGSTGETTSLQTYSVASLDSALLDLSRPTPQKEVINYGKELLDNLDRLKGFLLMGRVPQDELTHLQEIINKEKHTINDPHLQEIIRDIKVRVAVELAKLQR